MKTSVITIGVPLSIVGQFTNEELRLLVTTENYTKFRSKELKLTYERTFNVAIRFNEVVAESIRANAENHNWSLVDYTAALLANRG